MAFWIAEKLEYFYFLLKNIMKIRAFLIFPSQIIVYSFIDDNQENYLYNAGTLELITNISITKSQEIFGIVTDTFGVHPVVIGYDNDKLEIIYAKDSDHIYLSDGSLTQKSPHKIIVKCNIKVPQVYRNTIMGASNLADPDYAAIQNYIDVSNNKTPPEIKALPEVKACPQVKVSPEIKEGPKIKEGSEIKEGREIKEEPKIKEGPKVLTKTAREINQLTAEITALKEIIRVMNQRMYQLYPVNLPKAIYVDGKLIPTLSYEEIFKKITNGDIEKYELNPLLQAYGGSNRRNNRMITFYCKTGDLYLACCEYDSGSNKINPPKN